MRSLIDIVDLTVEEIDDLIATANDMQKSATAKNWRRSFLSLPPVHV